jgi:hypothetical protein
VDRADPFWVKFVLYFPFGTVAHEFRRFRAMFGGVCARQNAAHTRTTLANVCGVCARRLCAFVRRLCADFA